MNASKTPATAMPSMPLGEDYPEIRAAIRKICEGFPGAYWREKEEKEAYPAEFVAALTESGFLGALIPEQYGGAGLPIRAGGVILEEIHKAGCSAGACHAQMYIMGTLLRHGSERQKREYLPGIARGELRLQAFAVTEPTTGTDTTKLKTRAVRDGDHYVLHGQKVWTSRALHSDLMLVLARTTPREQVAKKTQGLSVFLLDIRECRGKGLERSIPVRVVREEVPAVGKVPGAVSRDRAGVEGNEHIRPSVGDLGERLPVVRDDEARPRKLGGQGGGSLRKLPVAVDEGNLPSGVERRGVEVGPGVERAFAAGDRPGGTVAGRAVTDRLQVAAECLAPRNGPGRSGLGHAVAVSRCR